MNVHASLFILAIATVPSLGCSRDFCEDFLKEEHPDVDCDNLGTGGASSSTTASMGSMTAGSMTQSSSSTGIDPTCIPSEPTWSPSETCGVFVKTGATGDGTPATPFGTIAEAQASKPGASIYICEGTYTESVTLAQSEALFGGLDCVTWAYDPTRRPTLTSLPDGIPLRISGTGTHRVEDIDITADDAMTASGSSIAVFVHQATVDFARVDITAGEGAVGDAGATEAKQATPAAANGAMPDEDGCEGTAGVFGADGGTQMCGLVDVSGGAGGNGRNTSTGDSGQDGLPNEATGLGGKGKDTSAMPDCANGQSGRPGDTGPSGLGAEASSLGTLDEAGYLGPEGAPGMGPGTPGQGGGGGGGSNNVCTSGSGAGPAGGGGGAGGCGGNPGAGGKGGGGSFALISVNAAITLTSVNLTAASGGRGGTGDAGQEGMDGGTFGLDGDPDGLACRGGSGGKGGRGGAGGGGRGGPSVAIAYVGTAPTENAGVMLFTAQEPASGGPGGNGGPTNMGGIGATGLVAPRQAW